MKSAVFALVALLAFAGVVLAFDGEIEDGVYVLTPDNFDAFIAENEFALVEFYAPWCGHCKSLAPHYAAAAGELTDVKLAKVDASEHNTLGQKFGVTGFPTLVWFENGESSPYGGGRTQETIVSWVSKATIAAIPEATAEELAAAKEDAQYAVIALFGGAADDEAHKEILGFYRNVDDVSVVAIYDADVIAAEGAADGDIKVYAKHSDDVATSTFESLEAFVSFIGSNAYPRVVEFDNSQFARVAQANDWIILGVTPFSVAEKKQALIDTLNSVTGEVGLLYADSTAMGRAVEGAGATGKVYPTFVGLNMNAQKQLVWDEEVEVTSESLNKWVGQLIDGTAEPFKKSEPVPEPNDGPVTVLVGKNFDDFVGEGKKTFVKYYAPWCGHCKTLAPIWEEVGEVFADNEVIIAKIDATANHIDEPVQGFPTLVFYDGEGNSEKYEGARTKDAIVEFVNSKVGGHSAHDEL